MLLIKNGMIYTMGKAGILQGDILIDNGKIKAVGKDLAVDAKQVIDASGFNIYPGLIEAHCHLGLHESSIQFEGNDVNESTDPITPRLTGSTQWMKRCVWHAVMVLQASARDRAARM